MPVSVRYRGGLLRQQLQAEERAVTAGLTHPAAHPSAPPQPPDLAMTAQGTAQPRSPQRWGLLCALFHKGNGSSSDKAAFGATDKILASLSQMGMWQ